MGSISHMNSRLCDLRVSRYTIEIRSHKTTIPGPGVFSVACRVNTNISTTGPNIAFKLCLLIIIKYVAGSHEKNNSIVMGQIHIGKNASVFSKINPKVMFSSKLLESYFPILDRGMTKSTRLGKDKQSPGT